MYAWFKHFQHCDKWGGAESRGNGARPARWSSLMIMNDTCATQRSQVSRRSFGKDKRRSDDSGGRKRTRHGFYFMCGSRPWEAATFLLCLFILLLKSLNVPRSPSPSVFYEHCYKHFLKVMYLVSVWNRTEQQIHREKNVGGRKGKKKWGSDD